MLYPHRRRRGGHAERLAKKRQERDAYAESGKADPDRLLQKDKELAKWQKAVDDATRAQAEKYDGKFSHSSGKFPSEAELHPNQKIVQCNIDIEQLERDYQMCVDSGLENTPWGLQLAAAIENKKQERDALPKASTAEYLHDEALYGRYARTHTPEGQALAFLVGLTPFRIVPQSLNVVYTIEHWDEMSLGDKALAMLDIATALAKVGSAARGAQAAEQALTLADEAGEHALALGQAGNLPQLPMPWNGALTVYGSDIPLLPDPDIMDAISDVSKAGMLVERNNRSQTLSVDSDGIADAVDAVYNGTNRFADIELPPNDSQLKHIFEDRPGHVPDTPENRQMLLDFARDPQYYKGEDGYGISWSYTELEDGRQMWVRYFKGIVTEGGINDHPHPWDDETGLNANPRANGTYRKKPIMSLGWRRKR